jgi:DNA repair exonuclease SbcCD ATPase subunit
VLESFTARNYQPHEDLRVDFDPQVTCIIGPTDAGKSAFLRALRWDCLNVPAGTAFIRQGSECASGEMVIDGRRVVRTRSASVNSYQLDDQTYEAFGIGVPDDIAKLLAVDAINFVHQRESDYLFSKSPIEAARCLNAVVDLGVIDEAQSRIGKKVWQHQETVKTVDAALTDCRAQTESLKWVPAADEQLQRVEQTYAKHAALAQRCELLESRIGAIRVHYATAVQWQAAKAAVDAVGRKGAECMARERKITTLSATVDGLRQSLQLRRGAAVSITRLSGLRAQHDAVQAKLDALGVILDELRKWQTAGQLSAVDAGRLQALKARWCQLDDRRQVLSRWVDGVRRNQTALELARSAEQKAQLDLDDALEGQCPVCGKELNEPVNGIVGSPGCGHEERHG